MPASGTVPNLELPTPCPVLVYTSQDVENPVLRLGSRDMEKALLHAERALQHAWTTITRVPSHLAQIQIRDDTKVALVVSHGNSTSPDTIQSRACDEFNENLVSPLCLLITLHRWVWFWA